MAKQKFLPEGTLLYSAANQAAIASAAALCEAMHAQRVLEARAVLCDEHHNLVVELGGGLSGFIPRNETAVGIAEGTTRDIAVLSRVGKAVSFRVTDIQDEKIILSRRLAQEDAISYYMTQAAPGDVIRAKVTHIEAFGAFADVGCGIVSLLGIEHISISRIRHPAERFCCGQDIYAVISAIDQMRRRLSLTHKELLGTWEENVRGFAAGQTVRGIIRGIEDYGVFVELRPNLSGLAEKRDGIREGQEASVFIKSILPERMKIKLIIIDHYDRPVAYPRAMDYPTLPEHISRWRYTPEVCALKKIETIFDPDAQ